MSRSIQEPVSRKDADGSTRMTHPAYGLVAINRTSGDTVLHGSDFRHASYITLTLTTGEIWRRLSGDVYLPLDQIVRVAFSEAQWASFVSSIGVGGGCPCTLERMGDEPVPSLPSPPAPSKAFAAEFEAEFEAVLAQAEATRSQIDAMGLPKGKSAEIKGALDKIINFVRSSAPFMQERFSERMEESVQAAKAEIHGHIAAVVAQAGAAALAARQPPLAINGDGADDQDSSLVSGS